MQGINILNDLLNKYKDNFSILCFSDYVAMGIQIAVIIIWYVMKYTRFGRYIYSIGGNENAAIAFGIKFRELNLFLILIEGLLVGLAGMVLT